MGSKPFMPDSTLTKLREHCGGLCVESLWVVCLMDCGICMHLATRYHLMFGRILAPN